MLKKIKGLNRRIFKRNLSRALKLEYKKQLSYTFENWVQDYDRKRGATGRGGWYELAAHETASGHAEEIRTN